MPKFQFIYKWNRIKCRIELLKISIDQFLVKDYENFKNPNFLWFFIN